MFLKLFFELVIISISIQSSLANERSHHKLPCSDLQITSERKDIEKINCENMDLHSRDINKNLLCLLPNLKEINLQNNKIDHLDFNIGCLIDAKSSKLELIQLEANQLKTIGSELIEKLKYLKLLNPKFRINLQTNPLVCNCSLSSFFKWVQQKESSHILKYKYTLQCLHSDSLHNTFLEPVYHSKLSEHCGLDNNNLDIIVPIETSSIISTTITFRTYLPTKPTRSSYIYVSKMKFSLSRFLLVFILSFFVIATILLLMTQNGMKFWRLYKQRRYRHFQDYNEDGTNINGEDLSSNVDISRTQPSIAFRSEFDDVCFSPSYPSPKRGLLTRLGHYMKSIWNNQRNKNSEEHASVYLESESSKTPDLVYRKYDKNDLKDEYFVDPANNVRNNPFIVHLMKV